MPGTKIDDFLEELHYLLSSATLPLSMNILEGVFQKHSPTTDKSVITEVATALCASNPLLKAIGKGGPLSTSYLRKQYYKESFKVVEPIEYILDAKEKRSLTLPQTNLFSFSNLFSPPCCLPPSFHQPFSDSFFHPILPSSFR